MLGNALEIQLGGELVMTDVVGAEFDDALIGGDLTHAVRLSQTAPMWMELLELLEHGRVRVEVAGFPVPSAPNAPKSRPRHRVPPSPAPVRGNLPVDLRCFDVPDAVNGDRRRIGLDELYVLRRIQIERIPTDDRAVR